MGLEMQLGDEGRLPFSRRKLKNRFLKAPMTERLATFSQSQPKSSGVVTPELINLYTTWGKGEIGILVTGNIMVDGNHIESAGNMILEDDSYRRVSQLKKLVNAAKANGSLCIAQISHPGRQANSMLQPNPVGVSDLQLEGTKFGMTFGKPTALTGPQIRSIVGKFATTARFCYEAGFDGVQLHAAHGYLLSQFLSTRTNTRTDEFGGGIANRARVIFEIIDSIRGKVPDSTFSISVKLNSVEFMDGFSTEDCQEFCRRLESKEVDFVELSGGTYEDISLEHKSESSAKREAYFLQFAKLVSPVLTRTLPYLTGGFRSKKAMLQAINEDSFYGIGMGRPYCDDPYLSKKLLDGSAHRAPPQKIDDALTILAAGIQLTRIAMDSIPLNLADTDQVASMKNNIGSWMAQSTREAEEGVINPGYPKVVA